MSFRHFLILAVTASLLASTAAFAETNLHDASGTFVGLLESVRNNANGWSGRLRGDALFVFWSLVLVQLVWTFGFLAIRQADFSEMAAELLKFVIVRGFFLSLLVYSVEWAEAIVNSFRQAGANAAGVGAQIYPGDMFALAVELAKTIGDVDTFNPLAGIIIGLSQLVVLLSFTFIAAFMAVTLVEAYFVINAAVFFMGFGGSQWTQQYAITMFRYALAVGAKLFVLTLLVGLVMTLAREWQVAYNMQRDEASMLTVVGLAGICAYLCKKIADLIGALITGVSSDGGSTVGGMAAAGMAFGVGAMAAIQASASGGMLGSAGKGVSDLLKSFGGDSGGSSMNMNSGGGGKGGSGGSSPRVGGGVGSGPAPGPAPKSASSASTPSGTSTPPGSSSGSSSKIPSVGTMAHAAAEMGIKTVGLAASVSVPGAEGSESLSVGPPPTPPDLDGVSASDTPENIIRPAAQESPVEPAPVMDTMSSLQEALNNRGKTS